MDGSNVSNTSDYNVTGKVTFNKGQKQYKKVKMMSDAYFLFLDDFDLEIDELIISKSTAARSKYEFLIQPRDGENGGIEQNGKDAPVMPVVNIVIHKLLNDVHIKSVGGNGGNGGDGINGGDGGNGGNGNVGGAGGNGGDGGDGGSGGEGGLAPKVSVRYTPVDNAKVIVLSRYDSPCGENTSFGGKGGKGGKGGSCGNGGIGGLHGNGKTRAPSGNSGRHGVGGSNGADGDDGIIDILINDSL